VKRRHRNVVVNDALLVLDTCASVAIRAAAPIAAGVIVLALSPAALAWGAYCALRRSHDHEPPSGDAGVA
jgi:hypothetical protein